MERVVIIGGGAAGMSCASRVRKLQPTWQVTVFEASSWVSHAPCGIPYVVEGVSELDRLMHYPPKFFIEKRNIDLHMQARVVEVGRGEVTVLEQGREQRHPWDRLLFACGAVPRLPPIPGTDLDGVFTADLPPDAGVIRDYMDRHRVENVVLIGTGYIALEMAEALVERGLSVTMLGRSGRILRRTFDPEITDIIEERLARDVRLMLREDVHAIQGEKRVQRVVTGSGELPADMVLLATGIRPDTRLARDLGLEIGDSGAIRTNDRMETSMAGVYAAGDVAECRHLLTGRNTWIALAPAGNKMGYVAGTNMAGREIRFPGVVGTAITRYRELEIGRTGLGEKEAREAGFAVISAVIHTPTGPAYFPGHGEIHLKGIVERDSGRLLGLQAVGRQVLARIDTFALALQRGCTTGDLFFADLAYAPPFAPVWDPLVVLARVLGI